MAKLTIFQKLSKVFSNNYAINDYTIDSTGGDEPLIAKTRDEYEQKKLQLRQQHLLARQWRKASYDITNKSLVNLNNIKMMYRDADIMDDFPEIGTALDIVMEECTYISDTGYMLNITSNSERIKSILQDLFINRLSVNTQLPMICRTMCKYGNTFMLLNIDDNNGITGWKMLPVYEVERFENGMENPYANSYVNLNNVNEKGDLSTRFVWVGQNSYIPYYNWQIAHFRLLYNSLYLPYGMSFLNKARRHFRMLSMMEDMMLIYRLERSIERRVFKINVGAIDEADVPAYVQQIADNFKRTPIVDPMTGQLDLRKNLLDTSSDFFIPVREDGAASPIETLPAAQNLTAMDDIKFMQNKVLTALRVPKSFLNFEESEGDGKNLSLLDIRFSKTVNRIQQSLIMELNKVAMIHLMLLGFNDELTNFNITMNNPSSQAEMLELENMAKKITTAKDAITDGGNGIPIMSVTRAWKTILKWSDKEISDNLEELRLEKALAVELEKTGDIIKRTGIFDKIDNVYGETGADYTDGNSQGNDMSGGGSLGTPSTVGGLTDFGEDMNTDETETEANTAGDNMADNGNEGEMSMGETVGMEEGLGESYMRKKLSEVKQRERNIQDNISKRGRYYSDLLKKKIQEESERAEGRNTSAALFNRTFLVNEELNDLYNKLGEFINK